jgi:opacity protein-like surface antigen
VRRLTLIAIITLSLAVPAAGQSTEIGGAIGYIPSASLDRSAPQFDETAIDGGLAFSFSAVRFLASRWGVEAAFIQQVSAFTFTTGDTKVELYDIDIAHVVGNIVYRFADASAKLRPFVFGGAGAAFFSADDLDSETKVSFGWGGGLAYSVSSSVSVEGRATYRPIVLNDSNAGDFCDAFGYCQSRLQQFDFMAGVKIRF